MSHWVTNYGEKIIFEKLSHQHLSNITYYDKLVLGQPTHEVILEQIQKRFGGIILPYQPLISFRFEINTLVEKGYTSGEPDAHIYVDGKWVGQIKYS